MWFNYGVKSTEKCKAIALRRQGLSYREVLAQVPVAKSALSLWLRELLLSKRQKQRLTEKKKASLQRGWAARRKQRIDVIQIRGWRYSLSVGSWK